MKFSYSRWLLRIVWLALSFSYTFYFRTEAAANEIYENRMHTKHSGFTVVLVHAPSLFSHLAESGRPLVKRWFHFGSLARNRGNFNFVWQWWLLSSFFLFQFGFIIFDLAVPFPDSLTPSRIHRLRSLTAMGVDRRSHCPWWYHLTRLFAEHVSVGTLNMQPEFYDYFVKRRKCQRPNKGFLHSQSSSTLLCSASTSICEHSTPMMQCRGFQSNSKYRYPHTQTGVANCSPCDILSL